MLDAEPYVRMISIDFSKAFDTVRIFEKIALLPLPDFLYNWLLQFFSERSHSTIFNGVISSTLKINCSIIQGTGMGPAMYLISASDLKPQHSPNAMAKYADDTYLLVPASSSHLANSEVDHVIDWAEIHNLHVNMAKCTEMILYHKGKPPQSFPPLLKQGILRVTETKVLGITFTNNLTMNLHVTNLVTKTNQSLYALRILRTHGLDGTQLYMVCRAYIENRLGYAISAWGGFTSLKDMDKLQKTINRAYRRGLSGNLPLPSIQTIISKADRVLFHKVVSNPSHVLHNLLPPERPTTSMILRDRPHNMQLNSATTQMRRNFIQRMLFLDAY